MSKIIPASELKRSDSYYYVQVFLTCLRTLMHTEMYFVVFADSKKEAIEKSNRYLDENIPKGYKVDMDKDVYYYHKNYIYQARDLVRQGQCI